MERGRRLPASSLQFIGGEGEGGDNVERNVRGFFFLNDESHFHEGSM